MSKIISARVEEDVVKRLETASKKSNLDKTSLIRIVLLKGLKELEETEALDSYEKGEISLGRLGDLLNMNKWDTIDLLSNNKISMNYVKEDFAEDTQIL